MRTPVAPTRHVRPRDARQRFKSSRDVDDEATEFRREILWKIDQVVVALWLQHHHQRCPRRLAERDQAPPLVLPERAPKWRITSATGQPILAASRRLGNLRA